jgi:transposase
MSNLFWLSEEQMARLQSYFPKSHGRQRVDGRRVLSGIIFVNRNGLRWRDVPPEYGPAKTIYNRYHRWSRRRIWQRIFEKMAASGAVPQELSIDSTHIKAHRSTQSSKGGRGRKRLALREAEEQAKSTVWPMIAADQSLSR